MARRTNCFIFALFLRFRWKHRGYWSLRPTRHFTWFGVHIGWHWLFIMPRRDGVRCWFIHADPMFPQKGWRAALHKFYFTPRIRRYDTEWKDE